ncbi:hypothetical protein LXA43DRAFT_707498 [Ganoderma leucocontextum]|nr:hypothetical protein LXA43DRAFT_707498 [Ganoderma leucocontextum]
MMHPQPIEIIPAADVQIFRQDGALETRPNYHTCRSIGPGRSRIDWPVDELWFPSRTETPLTRSVRPRAPVEPLYSPDVWYLVPREFTADGTTPAVRPPVQVPPASRSCTRRTLGNAASISRVHFLACLQKSGRSSVCLTVLKSAPARPHRSLTSFHASVDTTSHQRFGNGTRYLQSPLWPTVCWPLKAPSATSYHHDATT